MKDLVKSGRTTACADPAAPAAYNFGPFRLEVGKRRLWRGDQLVPLTPKACSTLLALVRQSGQVVDKDDLLKTVWPDTFVTEETLTQNIATVRKALGDSSERPEYVATIPRRGYQFVAIVTPPPAEEFRSITREVPPVVQRPGPVPRWRWVFMSLGLVAGIVAAGSVAAYRMRRSDSVTTPPGNDWQINPPAGTRLISAGELSPDGGAVAFVTIDNTGTTALWIQSLGTLKPIRLPGTDGAKDPFWSADGKALGFTAADKLNRIRLPAETPEKLADTRPLGHRGGTWSANGVIVYPAMENGPLYQLKADGTTSPVTRLEAGERVHLWPKFLPDGRHFLYLAAAFDTRQSATYVGSLDSMERTKVLVGSSSAAVYVRPGYILFVRDNTLLAQRFDPVRLRVEGLPTVVATDVAPPDEAHGMTFSGSGDVISYVSGGIHNQLEWFDRTGRSLGVLEGSLDMESPALSPDGTRVLASRPRKDVGNEIWVLPAAAGTPSRLDTGLAQGGVPTWSPDGRRVAFTSAGDVYVVPAQGGRADVIERSSSREHPLRVQDWSRDGRVLVYYTPGNPGLSPDVWWVSMTDGHAKPFLQSPADEAQAQLSPDMRWMAYTSNETGTYEVYVQLFPQTGSKRKISAHGGAEPQWRPDGRELFYLSADNTVMAVDVRPGARASFGESRPLFHIALNEPVTQVRNHYAVSRDGKRFLFSAPRPLQPPVTIRFHWSAGLFQ